MGMFLFHELLSHAELLKRKPTAVLSHTAADGRRAERRQRCGQVTLYPLVARLNPMNSMEEQPRVAAALTNISTTGVGLVHSEELSTGLEFEIRWDTNGRPTAVRLQVVHCRPMPAGMYRTGARLVAGVLPQEPELRVIASPAEEVIEVEPAVAETSDNSIANESHDSIPTHHLRIDSTDATDDFSEQVNPSNHLLPGVLRFEPVPAQPPLDEAIAPAPAGTFKIANALGFDKTERLEGVTTCGFERSIEFRRDGQRLYLYIHSPGKKNGWGIYVDSSQFQSAFDRVQSTAKSPFITTLAA